MPQEKTPPSCKSCNKCILQRFYDKALPLVTQVSKAENIAPLLMIFKKMYDLNSWRISELSLHDKYLRWVPDEEWTGIEVLE